MVATCAEVDFVLAEQVHWVGQQTCGIAQHISGRHSPITAIAGGVGGMVATYVDGDQVLAQ